MLTTNPLSELALACSSIPKLTWKRVGRLPTAPRLRTKTVDIVLMDIQMPELNGIEATKQLIAANPDTKVIMLTTFDDEEFVAGAIAAGASGFLLKDVEPEELFDAIRLVYDGQAVLAPTATAHVLELLKHPNQPAAPTPLTGRGRTHP